MKKILLIITVSILSSLLVKALVEEPVEDTIPEEPKIQVRNYVRKADRNLTPSVDHRKFDILKEEFSSPQDVTAACLSCYIDKSVFVDQAWVKTHLKDANVVLIDVRPPDEYHGTSTKPASKGHIPGAKNMEYTKILKDNGEMKSKAEIQALANEVGATADKTIVLYCGTSTRAGIVFLAFKTILGLPNVKVYDGAYNEWVVNNPVEK